MKPYDIEVGTGGLSVTYKVSFEQDGKYVIMLGEEKIAVIFPEVLDNGVVWYAEEEIDNLLLNEIGKAIEAEEM